MQDLKGGNSRCALGRVDYVSQDVPGDTAFRDCGELRKDLSRGWRAAGDLLGSQIEGPGLLDFARQKRALRPDEALSAGVAVACGENDQL
jgi:hypothetical protein